MLFEIEKLRLVTKYVKGSQRCLINRSCLFVSECNRYTCTCITKTLGRRLTILKTIGPILTKHRPKHYCFLW